MQEVLKKLSVKFSLIFFLITGCAGTGVVVTQENNKIVMPHYSIELPTNKGWKIGKINKIEESIHVTKRINSSVYAMSFNMNMFDLEGLNWTTKQLADNYRTLIVMDMTNKGYDLKDVVKNEEIIGEKKFYFMEYTLDSDNSPRITYVYLYCPNQDKAGDCIYSFYHEPKTEQTSNLVSLKQDFIDTLRKMRSVQ